MIQVLQIAPKHVPDFWGQARGCLQRTIEQDQGKIQFTHVLDYLVAGEWQLWAIKEQGSWLAAATTSIEDYPRYKTLAINLVGGRHMRRWLPDFAKAMEAFGRAQGCATLEGYGREAWGRALQRYGWNPALTVFERKL